MLICLRLYLSIKVELKPYDPVSCAEGQYDKRKSKLSKQLAKLQQVVPVVFISLVGLLVRIFIRKKLSKSQQNEENIYVSRVEGLILKRSSINLYLLLNVFPY